MSLSNDYVIKLKKWIELDNSIRKYNKELSNIRKKRTELESYIIEYGKSNNILDNTLKFQNNIVTYNTSYISPTLNYSFIEECLGEVLNSNDQIAQIMEHIKRKRELNKKTNIILKNKLK